MYHLATTHSVTGRQTGRQTQTDRQTARQTYVSIMPTAHHTVC